MFELIEDHDKPDIKRWTMPAAIIMVFLCGMEAGILIGRRKLDFFDWAQLAFLLFLTWRFLSPLLQEITHRLRLRDGHDR